EHFRQRMLQRYGIQSSPGLENRIFDAIFFNGKAKIAGRKSTSVAFDVSVWVNEDEWSSPLEVPRMANLRVVCNIKKRLLITVLYPWWDVSEEPSAEKGL